MSLKLVFPLLLLVLLPGISQAAEKPSELRDLHYGETLYQLYQKNYFAAIVHLLSARQQGRMQAYGDEPELLLGGLYLAYGMTDAAEAIFQQTLQQNAVAETTDRAWLMLAKSRHRRNQAQAAMTAMGRIGDTLTDEDASEHYALGGLLALQRQDNSGALTRLQEPPSDGIWSHYVEFNRAIALLRLEQNDQALELLQDLGRLDAETAETKALRDRANLLLGYLLLEAKQPQAAREALERIRLNGLAANQALLGIGWIALQEGNPQAALPPWQLLSQRTTEDPSVLEAMLAIPYALSLLEADQQALDQYQLVITRFAQELGNLDQAIDEVEQGRLFALLEERPPGLQQEARPLPDLLPLLLTENRFQERLQDYRDLQFLQQNLQQWHQNIGTYRTMLEVRERAYAEVQPRVETKLAGDELQALSEHREKLARALQAAKSENEPLFSLARDEELGLIQRFDKIDDLLERIGRRTDLSAQRQRAKLLRGTLIWRTMTEHPARVWELTKLFRQLDQALEETQYQQDVLKQAHQQTQGRFQGFDARIKGLEAKIPGLQRELEQTSAKLRRLLRSLAIEALDKRKQLIHNYLIQARFGLATLLDRNAAAGEAK